MDGLRSSLARLTATGIAPIAPLGTSEIVIYGAGNCGRKVAAQARANGISVRAFVDSRDGLTICEGVPCFAPHSREAAQLARDGVAIVLAIFNYATDLRPIHRMLTELGFSRIVSYPEFHELHDETPDFWLTQRGYYRERRLDILETFDLFEDEVSRQIYHDCLVYRLTFNSELLQDPDTAHHYLAPDLPQPVDPMRLIDCGAFTGDSITLFLKNGIRFDAVAAFEPDPENYKQLSLTLTECKAQLRQRILVPCAVGDVTQTGSFCARAGANSAIGGEAANIQVVALDDVLPDFAPNFIKFDVEGSEPSALSGAAKLVRRFLPRLAVSVYHAPDHLWTIPKLIRKMEPRYRLALRYHQWNGFDMVAYAFIP